MNICVFCSSSNGIDDVYFDNARDLGRLIGERGHGFVYGGSNVGLMEASALSAREAGADVVGVIPKAIEEKGLASTVASELIVTANMRERKYLLRKRSDAFVALAGGFGTLEELLEVITLKQLEYHMKPIVIMNTNGFYDPLIEQFERSYAENFAKDVSRRLYFVTRSAEEAIDYIENYKPESVDSKWFKVPEK